MFHASYRKSQSRGRNIILQSPQKSGVNMILEEHVDCRLERCVVVLLDIKGSVKNIEQAFLGHFLHLGQSIKYTIIDTF